MGWVRAARPLYNVTKPPPGSGSVTISTPEVLIVHGLRAGREFVTLSARARGGAPGRWLSRTLTSTKWRSLDFWPRRGERQQTPLPRDPVRRIFRTNGGTFRRRPFGRSSARTFPALPVCPKAPAPPHQSQTPGGRPVAQGCGRQAPAPGRRQKPTSVRDTLRRWSSVVADLEPRVVTGGCWARTQEATHSNAARARRCRRSRWRDAAQRRRGRSKSSAPTRGGHMPQAPRCRAQSAWRRPEQSHRLRHSPNHWPASPSARSNA
jgi:hypothetical protein